MAAILRRTAMITLCALTLLAVSGCGNGAKTSAPTTTSATPASSAATHTYSSKAFVVPLTVTVDAGLKSPPNPDSPNLLSWDAAASDFDNAVRFFVPVIVYRPGSDTPQAPPKDYLTYLQSQTKDGAEFSKATKITVDGHPATLMTATSTIDASHPQGFMDGSIGCSERTADKRAHDLCRGIQPDYLLRMAVIDLGETTLLAWARVHKDNPDPAFVAMFEQLLSSVRFR
jgi:hypothetical protein